MDSLQNFDYNGQLIQRRADGFVNLTQMCQAHGKRLDVFLKVNKTKGYIDALTQSHQMVVLDSDRGGNHSGTWGHPSLAINLARWISPQFAVWCDAHIFNLLSTGQTSLEIDPIEEMKLKIQLATLENQKVQADLALTNLRYTITQTCPEPVQQKVLGYSTIKEVEYRDRIIKDDDVVNNGSTATKTELCKRYGILTKTGKPDFKRLDAILIDMPELEEAWENSIYLREHKAFKREYLPLLDERLFGSQRQLYLGEQPE